MTDRAAASEVKRRERVRAVSVAHWALLGLACAYYGGFIFRASFVVDGTRYNCLFDDAMVSMRYARNLAHGYGLVWNPGGERVEGFTNPLWTLYMSLLHLLPLAAPRMSLLIQITGGALLLVNLGYVRRIALLLSPRSDLAAFCAVALTAFYLPLVNWSLQGMEVSLLTLLVTAAAYYLLASLRRGEFSALPYLLLGTALLVRLDAIVCLLAIIAFGMLADRPHRRHHLLSGLIAVVLGVGSQTAFRLWYYGDLLPNTYYLKMTGYPASLRVLRGLYYYWLFVVRLPWWLLLLALLPIVRPIARGPGLLATLFCAQSAYSIYVGADVWEWWGGSNRYLGIAMPALFLLVALGLTGLLSWTAQHLEPRARWALLPARILVVTLGLMCLLYSNSFTRDSRQQWLLLRPLLHQPDNCLNVQTAMRLREVTTDQALIALSWAGAIPYFSDRPSHDLLGKCDRRIAREAAHVITGWNALDSFVPGHLKWDFDYSILQSQPDVVLRDISRGPEQKAAFLQRYRSFYLEGQEVYVRLGSSRVNWPAVFRLDAEEKERRRAERAGGSTATRGPTGASRPRANAPE